MDRLSKGQLKTEDWMPEIYPIPSHWQLEDFESVFENVSLTGLKLPQKEYELSGNYPVIDQGVKLIGGYTNDVTKVINSRAAIIFGDHTKCFKYINFPFVPGADGVKVLFPRKPINERFAYYCCTALRLPDRGYSRHYSFLKKTKFPVPPLNEQHRIVTKIEELFSELDKGIESLKTAREQLKIYRQTVLKHAFEGKLTAKWRAENNDKLESPEKLVARIEQEREERYLEQMRDWAKSVENWQKTDRNGKKSVKPRKPKLKNIYSEGLSELPNKWEWEIIGNLNVDVFDGPFGSNLKTSDYVDEGIRVIRLENIGVLEFIDEKKSYISESKYQSLKKHNVRSGDIIFSSFISEEIRVAELPDFIDRAINKADCFCMRFFGEVINAKFVMFFFSTRYAFNKIKSKIHGVGRPRINTTQLKEFLVPICDRREQDEILSVLNNKLSLIENIKNTIQSELNRSEILRQSILKKAFSGQLVPQDSTNEPASVLLERIHKERRKE